MRFWCRREAEDQDPIEQARGLLGDVPAVTAAAERPGDPVALSRLATALLEYDCSDEEFEVCGEIHSRLVVAKLHAQGLSPDEIRGWSLAELAHQGLPAPPPHFPTILEAYAGGRRSAQDVVDRIRALHGVLAAAYGQPGDEVLEKLTERGLLEWVTDEERVMLAAKDDEAQKLRVQISWRMECLSALGWAVGIYDELPIEGTSEAAPEDFVSLEPEADAGVPADVTLRDERELMARLDVFYCAHWAVRDHDLTGLPEAWPDGIVDGAVWERRHALEWLLSDTPWDDIDLST